MPRNVRNFWIEVEVDGKKEAIAFGPKAGSGGFTMRIFMRNEGSVDLPVKLIGHAHDDGSLSLVVDNKDGPGFTIRRDR